MSSRDGVICSISNRNEKNDKICEIMFDYTVGDQVKKFRVGPNRIGHVITKGDTLEDATRVLQEALDKIEIQVE